MTDTKTKYIMVSGKLYEVEKISFYHMIIQARTCEKDLGDVPEDEVFPWEDVAEFTIVLEN